MSITPSSHNVHSAGFSLGSPTLKQPQPSSEIESPHASEGGLTSFDSVLAKVDDPIAPAEVTTLSTPSLDPPMTPEELALLVSMIFPNPALAPPPPPNAALSSLPDPSSSLQLIGANGRNIPELLASGTDVLEYQASAQPIQPLKTGVAIAAPGLSPVSGNSPTSSGLTPDQVSPLVSNVPASPTPSEKSGSSEQGNSAHTTATTNISGVLEKTESISNIKSSVGGNGPGGVFLANSIPVRFDHGLTAVSTPRALEPIQSQITTSIAVANTPTAIVSAPPPIAFNGLLGPGPTSATATSLSSVASPPVPPDTLTNDLGLETDNPNGKAEDSQKSLSRSIIQATAIGQNATVSLRASSINGDNGKNMPLPPSMRRIGEKTSSAQAKNSPLIVDPVANGQTAAKIGAIAATGGAPTYYDSRNFLDEALQRISGALNNSTGNALPNTPNDLKNISSAHTSELVTQIREIADGLWSVERNSVEVKFNFGEQERLSVRVEYRDGTVRATFRTDSADVRDAISREWQGQMGSGEQRPYRVAEPVFTGGAPAATGFSMGGDGSRQQRSSAQSQPIPFEVFRTGVSSREPQPASSLLSSNLIPARETGGRFQAFV